MPIYAYDSGGTRRLPSAVYAYDSSGTRRIVQLGYAYDSAGNRQLIYAALSVSASNVFGSNSGFANSGSVTGTGASAVATGGSGSYSYQWSHVSTSSGNTPGIGNPTSVNPTWSATVQDGVDSVSVWKLVVTDVTYSVTAETTITVTLSWTNQS